MNGGDIGLGEDTDVGFPMLVVNLEGVVETEFQCHKMLTVDSPHLPHPLAHLLLVPGCREDFAYKDFLEYSELK